MKFAIKTLVGAMVLAAAGQASAFTTTATNDDLLLTVWDDSLGVSYSRDLGISTLAFLASDSASQLFSQTTGLFSTLFGSEANSSNISWNLVGSGTSTKSTSILATVGTPGLTNNGNGQLLVDENTFMGDLNSLASGSSATEASVNSTSNPAYGGAFWGSNYKVVSNTTSPTGFGSAQGFSVINGGGSGITARATSTQLPLGSFSLLANGSVQYGPVSAVPIPAALWLMGSGLVGLLGVGRRRKAA